MFSDHLSKIDRAPTKTLLMVAGGLVIICQLVAMAMVAGGQVEKAQLREANQASLMAATVWCLQSSRGAAVSECGRTSAIFTNSSGVEQPTLAPSGINLVPLGNRY